MKESFVDKIKKTTVGKKERCLTPENLAETGVRLRGLEKKYRLIVRMETEKVRTAREKRKEDERAQLKLKNAYYALSIVRAAREQLQYVSTVESLCEAVKEMDQVLKMLDTAYAKTARAGGRWFTNRAASTVERGGDGRLARLFAQPIDVMVDDDIVDRLARGDSVDECLEKDDGIKATVKEAVAYSEEYMAQTEPTDLFSGDLDESLHNDLESIKEMVGNMVRDA